MNRNENFFGVKAFFAIFFATVFAIVFAAKIFLLFRFPLTGDEAYFIQWGKDLSAGYYDHTPMVGWINFLLGLFIDDYRFYRLFSIVAILTTGFVIYRVSEDRIRGALAAMIWWVSPASLLLVPMLNDSCLLFFTALSYYWFYRWKKNQSFLNAVICGAFLGLAFLSKYLAIFVGVGYLASVVFSHRKKVMPFLAAVLTGSLPAVMWNLIWNQQNCWNNIMFNLLNRQMTQSEGRPDLYLLSVVGLLTPWLCWAVIRRWKQLPSVAQSWCIMFLGPFFMFGLMSLKRIIGLHWLVPFAVPFFITISYLPFSHLKRLFRYSAISAMLILTIVVIGIAKADFIIKKWNLASSQLEGNAFLTSFHPEEVCDALDRLTPVGFQKTVTGYPPAAILEHRCRLVFPILFATGVYGRQCDKRDDLSLLNGKDLSLYVDSGVAERYGSFFESYEIRSTPVSNTTITVLLGRNFHFEKYRLEVLSTIAKSYYSSPKWLPNSKCYFLSRYFPDGLESTMMPTDESGLDSGLDSETDPIFDGKPEFEGSPTKLPPKDLREKSNFGSDENQKQNIKK